VTEIGFARAGSDHQLVVGNAALADQHGAACDIDAGDGAEDHLGIRPPRENAADRCRDVGGRQCRGGDLIKQRLEQVMVALVDHGDSGGCPTEPDCGT